ncbi:MAG: FkbM family methyltransferase [Planctomycetota bacterium]|nr:FkbM family methyltransferase [Planctomycetota bacterium]
MRARKNSRRIAPPEIVDVTCEPHGDGGAAYYICPDQLSARSVVYSFGVGSNISFDRSLIDTFGLSVFAFDPTDESAKYVASHPIGSNYSFRQVGLSAADGTIQLRTIKRASRFYRPATVLEIKDREAPAVEVPARSLKSIMAELGHEFIDILKMDIEGGELAVIEDLARSHIPAGQIVLEFHPHLVNLERSGHFFGAAGWDKTGRAIEQLLDNGYGVFHVSERGTDFSFIRT